MQLEELNDTELWEIARLQLSANCRRPVRLSRSVSRERVIELILTAQEPDPREELIESRVRLEKWIAKNWVSVNSQLPCHGKDRGKCTIFACPEGRHLLCYSANADAVIGG